MRDALLIPTVLSRGGMHDQQRYAERAHQTVKALAFGVVYE